ncbi:hypothetical protein KR032_002650, partial [Drosophila birchii]
SLAINSSISDTTGFSPAFLVQGREPRLPHALYDEVTPGRGTPEVTPTERTGTTLVLVRRHALSNATEGFAAKLAAKYDGPFKVAKFPSPNIVQLHIPGSRRRRTASLSQLKPYHGEEADTEEDENEEVAST